MLSIVIIQAVITLSTACSVPFQVCKRADPSFEECLKIAIQDALVLLKNGLPDYGIPSIHPIKVLNDWVVPAKFPLVYDQQYKNTEIFNYSSTIIRDLTIKVDGDNLFLDMAAYNPAITTTSDYQYDNAIIRGEDLSSKGRVSSIYGGMEFELNFIGKIKKYGKDKRVEITNVIMNIIGMEEFYIEFHSADAKKDKKLGEFYNQNAQHLIAMEKEGYEIAYAKIFKDIANVIFSKFSFDDLFTD